jgi:hypothetical protein
VIKKIDFAPGGVPVGLSFANDTLLVLNYDIDQKISTEMIQINLMNGKTLRSLPCPEQVDTGVVYDNNFFWGSSASQKCICKFMPGTGELVDSIEFEFPVSALGWDGENLIVGQDKMEKEKVSSIGVYSVKAGKFLKETEIDCHIGGLTFAEEMVFYTSREAKEIQVIRFR